MKASNVVMSGQNIASSLYALQGMNVEHDETRLILSALAHKLMTTSAAFTGLDIGMSLYGLRGMAAADVPEVTVILGLLVHKIKTSKEIQLEVGELSLAVIGVHYYTFASKYLSYLLIYVYMHIGSEDDPVDKRGFHVSAGVEN